MSASNHKFIIEAGVTGQTQVNTLKQSIDNVAGSANKFVSEHTRGITLLQNAWAKLAGAAGLYKFVDMMGQAVAAASNLQEVSSKFDVVFKGQEQAANRWAKVLVDSYAMSTREAKEYMGSLQDLLKPMGVVPSVAAKMSFEISKLSADLGSFNNQSTAKVMADIQSALVGNYETMKKYGVVVNESAVKQEALNVGLIKGKEELDSARKAAAAYSLILKGTADAQGDQHRTMDSYANQLKSYKAGVEDLSAAVGAAMIPALTELFAWLTKLAKAWKDAFVPDMSQMVMEKMTGDLHAMQLELAKFEGVAHNKTSPSIDAALDWLPGYITQEEAQDGIRTLKARIKTLNQTIETEYAKMAAEHDQRIKATGKSDPLKFTENSFEHAAKAGKDAAAEAKELKEYIDHVNNALENLIKQAENMGQAFQDGHWEAQEAAEKHKQALRDLYNEGMEGEQDWLIQTQHEVNAGIELSVKTLNAKNIENMEHFRDRMQDLFVDVFRSIRDNGIDSFEDIFTAASGFLHDIQAEVFGQMIRNVMTGKSPGEGLSGFFGIGGTSGGSGGISTGWWNQPLFTGGTSGSPTSAGDLPAGGLTRGQGAVTAAFAAAAIYDIYMQSAGMSKTSGMISGGISGGVSGGLAGGFIGGAMAGGTATSWSGPYAAIGAAVGAIIGGIAGYLGGADAPQKAKFRLGSGNQVNPKYPSTETPFGTFGFDEAKVINTNQFKQQIDLVGQATKVLADMMDEATISNIRTFMGDWQSGKAKGDISAAEFEEQFVNYFHEIGIRWNSELGDWVANFNGTLDDLTSAILAHRDIMHEVDMIIDPTGTTMSDINDKYDNYHLMLQESVESVQEAAKIERARRIELNSYAESQQRAAAAEYEREQAELARIAKLHQAYAEFRISLMPADVGQQAQWGMIQDRWGLENMGLPSGPQAKSIISGLASDENLADRIASFGETGASQFQADVMWIKAIADAFDNLVGTAAQTTEGVLNLVTATDEINLYWDNMRDALIAVGYEGQLLTNIESARGKQLADLDAAEAKLYKDIEFQTGSMIGIYDELEIAQRNVTEEFMGYWTQIKDTEHAMDAFPELANRYAVAMENVNRAYQQQIYTLQAALPGLTAKMQKQFIVAGMEAKYGLASGTITSGFVNNVWKAAGTPGLTTDMVQTYLDDMGFKTTVPEFYQDIGTLWDAFDEGTQAVENFSGATNDAAQTFKNAIGSIDDLILRLTGGDLAPVQSAEFFTGQYAKLLGAARQNPENAAAFTGFVPEMLQWMGGYGMDYKELASNTVSDLQGLKASYQKQSLTVNVNVLMDGRVIGTTVVNQTYTHSDLINRLNEIVETRVSVGN